MSSCLFISGTSGSFIDGNIRPTQLILSILYDREFVHSLVEIPLVARLTVYLGRPVYSLAVVLFSLLLFSGLGSLWSGRRLDGGWPRPWLLRIFLLLAGGILLHATLVVLLLDVTLGFSLPARLAITVAILAVPGFLMGIPFPVGIRHAGRRDRAVIPWLWAINGIISVVGSALAVTISLHVGFSLTLVLAAAIYTAAGLMLAAEIGRLPVRATPAHDEKVVGDAAGDFPQ